MCVWVRHTVKHARGCWSGESHIQGSPNVAVEVVGVHAVRQAGAGGARGKEEVVADNCASVVVYRRWGATRH